MIQPIRFWSLLICTLTSAMCLSGCGKKVLNASTAEKIPVTGRVLLSNGQPLTIGSITFKPDDPCQGPAIVASLQETGAFRLAGDDGASTGFYAVYLDLNDPKSPRSNYFRSIIPEQYLDPDASPLRIEIKPSESNDFTFNLD